MSRKRLLIVAAAFFCASVLAFVLLAGCAKPAAEGSGAPAKQKRFHESRNIMGTIVSVTLFAGDKARAKEAIDAGFERVVEIDRLMSTYKEDSEISRLNRQTHSAPFPVSADTFYVLEKSIKFSKLSDGAFDISVAPLIAIWRAAGKKDQLPSESDLLATAKGVGYNFIELAPNTRSVKLLREGMEVNLGGIAKGYAVDVAITALKEHGIKNGLVDAGGDIYAMGGRPDGSPWRIGVQDPTRPDAREWLKLIELRDRAVATSGNYQRYYTIGGKRYSHIIDPRTGSPADAVPSVTIIAPDTTSADAVATAVSVLGVEKGMALVEAMEKIEAMLITMKDGEMTFVKSTGFESFEPDHEKPQTKP